MLRHSGNCFLEIVCFVSGCFWTKARLEGNLICRSFSGTTAIVQHTFVGRPSKNVWFALLYCLVGCHTDWIAGEVTDFLILWRCDSACLRLKNALTARCNSAPNNFFRVFILNLVSIFFLSFPLIKLHLYPSDGMFTTILLPPVWVSANWCFRGNGVSAYSKHA